VGDGLAYHSLWRINEREFGKISEKDLTVKDSVGGVYGSFVKVALKFG